MKKWLAAIGLAVVTAAAHAAQKQYSVCVFDPVGANGDAYSVVKDYALEARGQGVDFNLKPYTDESVALGDFLSGQCDVLAATDLRTRRFNRFTGTINSVGAIPDYKELKTVLMTMATPKAAKYMTSNGYTIIGIFPLGAAYLFVDNKNINTAGKLAGKRIATLSYQKDAIHMVKYVNATVVPSDITNFGSKFNNGQVDACYAPAYAYKALELYKGIGDNGGVVDYPLAQPTMQLVTKAGTFDDATAQKLREDAANLFGEAMNVVKRSEKEIPKKDWIHISKDDIKGYQEMFRHNRIELRDGSNGAPKVYSAKMLTFLRKVRCKYDPANSECTAPDRE